MALRQIQIVDKDSTAAMVTCFGLQLCLKSEADVAIAPLPQAGEAVAIEDPSDLLIVDPGGQSQAASRLIMLLKQACPHTPILVLTAYDSPLLRRQMQQLDVAFYLAKPVDLLDLVAVVRGMLSDPPYLPASPADGWLRLPGYYDWRKRRLKLEEESVN